LWDLAIFGGIWDVRSMRRPLAAQFMFFVEKVKNR